MEVGDGIAVRGGDTYKWCSHGYHRNADNMWCLDINVKRKRRNTIKIMKKGKCKHQRKW